MNDEDLVVWLDGLEDTHDVEAMRMDIENNNLEPFGDAEDYRFENIVHMSLINGQLKQAVAQHLRFFGEEKTADELKKHYELN